MSSRSLRPSSFAVGAACGVAASVLAWFFFPRRSHTRATSQLSQQNKQGSAPFPSAHSCPFLSPREAGVLTLLSAYAITASTPSVGTDTPRAPSTPARAPLPASALAAPSTPASSQLHAARLRALRAYIRSHLSALAAEEAFVEAVGQLFDAIHARASVRRAAAGLQPLLAPATRADSGTGICFSSCAVVTAGDVAAFMTDLAVPKRAQAPVLALLTAVPTGTSKPAAPQHRLLTRRGFLSALRVWERAPAAAAALGEFEWWYAEQYLPLLLQARAQARAEAAQQGTTGGFETPQKVKPPSLTLSHSSSSLAAANYDEEEEQSGGSKGETPSSKGARAAATVAAARAGAAAAAVATGSSGPFSPAPTTYTSSLSPAGPRAGLGAVAGEEGADRPSPLPRLLFPPPSPAAASPSSPTFAPGSEPFFAAFDDGSDDTTEGQGETRRPRGLPLFLTPSALVRLSFGADASTPGVMGDGRGWSPLLSPSSAAQLRQQGVRWVEAALGQWKPAAAALGPVMQAWAGWVAVAPAVPGQSLAEAEAEAGAAVAAAAELAGAASHGSDATDDQAASDLGSSQSSVSDGARVIAIVPYPLTAASSAAADEVRSRVVAAAVSAGVSIAPSAAAAADLVAAAATAEGADAAELAPPGSLPGSSTSSFAHASHGGSSGGRSGAGIGGSFARVSMASFSGFGGEAALIGSDSGYYFAEEAEAAAHDDEDEDEDDEAYRTF